MTTLVACALVARLCASAVETPVTLNLVHKNVFLLGAPIEFRCVLTNTTKKPVKILSSGIWANYRFVVKNEKGVEPPLTAFGAQARARYASPNRDKNFPVVIPPGKTHEVTVDLALLYNLPRGKWTLLVTHEPCPPAIRRQLSAAPARFVVGTGFR